MRHQLKNVFFAPIRSPTNYVSRCCFLFFFLCCGWLCDDVVDKTGVPLAGEDRFPAELRDGQGRRGEEERPVCLRVHGGDGGEHAIRSHLRAPFVFCFVLFCLRLFCWKQKEEMSAVILCIFPYFAFRFCEYILRLKTCQMWVCVLVVLAVCFISVSVLPKLLGVWLKFSHTFGLCYVKWPLGYEGVHVREKAIKPPVRLPRCSPSRSCFGHVRDKAIKPTVRLSRFFPFRSCLVLFSCSLFLYNIFVRDQNMNAGTIRGGETKYF